MLLCIGWRILLCLQQWEENPLMKSTELLYRKIGHLLYHSWQCDFLFFFSSSSYWQLQIRKETSVEVWLLVCTPVDESSPSPCCNKNFKVSPRLFLKHSRDKPRNNKKHEMCDAEVFMYKPGVDFFKKVNQR